MKLEHIEYALFKKYKPVSTVVITYSETVNHSMRIHYYYCRKVKVQMMNMVRNYLSSNVRMISWKEKFKDWKEMWKSWKWKSGICIRLLPMLKVILSLCRLWMCDITCLYLACICPSQSVNTMHLGSLVDLHTVSTIDIPIVLPNYRHATQL
jgi:hypothetical protein